MSKRTSRVSFGVGSVALPPPSRVDVAEPQENKEVKRNVKAGATGGGKKSIAGIPKPSNLPKSKPRESIKPPKKSLNPLPRPSVSYGHTGRSTIVGTAADRRGSRSSLYGRGPGPQIKKDPRPLNDKAFLSQSIKKILAFLRENGYPHSLTYQNLQSPSGKEFCGIFNFLLERIHPTMTITGAKMEEEVPRTLGYLGYPFTVAKSCLKSVGSPHAWPILVGVLTWLIELVNMDVPSKANNICFPRDFLDDGPTESEVYYRSVTIMYNVFINEGQDSDKFGRELDMFKSGLRSAHDIALEENEQLLAENEELKETVAVLSQSKIPPIQEELERKTAQRDKFAKLVEEDLVSQVHKYSEHVKDLADDVLAIENDIVNTREKIKELESIIASQPLSADEAQRMYDDRLMAENTLSEQRQVEEEKVTMRNEVLMRYNESLREVTTATKQINDKVQWLSSSLGTKFTALEHAKDGKVDAHSIENLKRQVVILKDELESAIHRLTSLISACDKESVGTEETIATLHEEVLKQQIELNNMQATLDIKTQEVERKEKVLEEVMRSEASEKQLIERERNEISAETSTIQIQAKRDLYELQKKYEGTKAEKEKEVRKELSSLKDLCSAACDFAETSKAFVKEALEKVEEERHILNSAVFVQVDRKYLK